MSHCSNSSLSLNLFSIREELVAKLEAGKVDDKNQATKKSNKGQTRNSLCVQSARSQRFFTWSLSNAVSHCSNASLSLNLFSTCAEVVAKVEAGKGEDKSHATKD